MFEKVLDIVTAKTTRLDELMHIAEGNPRTFWVGADFRKLTFGDISVRRWCFHAADLTGCDLSQVKDLDKATFTSKTKLDGVILPEGMTVKDLVFEKILGD